MPTINIYDPVKAQTVLDTLPARRLQNMLVLLRNVDNGDYARLDMIAQIEATLAARNEENAA